MTNSASAGGLGAFLLAAEYERWRDPALNTRVSVQ